MNYYSVYFCSKNTGPRTIEIEARSDTDARAQINARFPGVTNMSTIQLQQSSSQKAADEARRKAEYNATQARFKQEDADRAAHQRQMKQDARDRQARQEANNRADQARRDQERRDEQARQDRERQERQHRETLNAIKSNKSSGVLPFVAGAALGYVAGRNTQPDAVVVAPYDEEIGSQSWWEQRALASQSFTTREAELLFLEESVDTVCHARGLCRGELNAEAMQNAKDVINEKWDRREEEAREPHGPRQPMTETDYNTVNAVIALVKKLPFTIHILWYPPTQILGCIFDDLSLMLKSLDPNPHYNRIIEMLDGKVLGIRGIRFIPYATDGPANAPFEIAEEWLQENGYWFFRGPF